jgi:tRNA threonylcarbamoyladenosine biosynthesis protein TsaE
VTVIETHSEKETFNHGVSFSKKIKILPSVILLQGSVGAGKTSWVKGFVWGYLKKKNIVTSSSYSLVNGYSAKNKEVIHMDLYRLQSQDDLESVGFWDFLTGRKIIILEWGEPIQHLPKEIKAYSIKFEMLSENSRRLLMS